MESKKISCKIGEADFTFETGKLAARPTALFWRALATPCFSHGHDEQRRKE